jgi:Rps23 Pro-64 3,4-dihydroxylase Tpa1-like proline 4-hydroxylase
MRTYKKLLATCLITSSLIGGLVFMRVSAQSAPMAEQQVELIRNNCTSAKTTLNQLHSSDALLRVNRGQIYESMSTKLMEKFDSRVSSNGMDNSELALIVDSYGTVMNSFRSDYIVYEKQLTSTIGIDCLKHPTTFYDAVVLAKTERNQVHSDVLKLNQLIDQYQAAVLRLETNYQATSQGSKQQ